MSIARPQPIPFGRNLVQTANAGINSIGRLPTPVTIYLVLVMTPAAFTAGSLYLTVLRIFLLVMVIPLLFRLVSGRYGRILMTDILFVLHMAWAAVALWVNNPDQVVTQMGSIGPEFLGGYLVGRAYIRNKADFIALCRWLGLAVCVLFPFAIFETLTGVPPIVRAIEAIPAVRSVNDTGMMRMGLSRVQGVFSHPIHFGLFCSTAVSLTFVAMKGVLPTFQRLAISFVVASCVFVSLSSGALLAMIMHIILIGWAAIFLRTGKVWTLLLITTVIAYVAVDLLSDRTPVRVFFSYATFSSHNAYWRGIIFDWGMRNVWANPVYGLGLNDWVRPFFMYSGSMDNFWLVMAVRYGIPGFLTIAVGYAIGMWRVGRRDFSADAAMILLRRAWMFTFLGLTFTLCTVHLWTALYSYVFFLFGAGMWFITATDSIDKGEGPDSLQQRNARRPGPQRRGEPSRMASASIATDHDPKVEPPADSGSAPEESPYTRFARHHQRQFP